jgi:hypothetical protein
MTIVNGLSPEDPKRVQQRVNLKNIYCEPVWKENQIELFDMYIKTTGEWLGSKRLLRYCEEVDSDYIHR